MLRPCLGCGEPGNASRCQRCTSERNIARGSSTARGLGSKWRRVRARQLRRQPICQLRYEGCLFIATEGDHIIPRAKGGESTPSNVQSACKPCNVRRRFLEEHPE